jgi:VWFA-related protein
MLPLARVEDMIREISKVLIFVLLAVVAWSQTKPESPSASTQPVIRAGTEEVLLDLVVRDKKGKLVRDLKPGEVEIYDDGTRQNIAGFRLTSSPRVESLTGPAQGTNAPKTLDPLRTVRLVSLLFEGLDNDARRLARQAALEFLKTELEQNVYVAVFTIHERLYILQQFTNDRDLLRKAIDRATAAHYTQLAEESAAIRKQLEALQNDQQTAEASLAASQPGRNNPSGAAAGQSAAAAKMAQTALNMLQFEESMTRLQQARSSIFSLLSVIRGQVGLPGRKTVVYFSDGMQVPDSVIEQFNSMISAANVAGVTVYAVDARGLTTEGQNSEVASMLQSAVRSSRRQQTAIGEATNPDQVRVFDTARDSMHANRQQALENLAVSTGGFLIANTNDYRTPFQRISEDINSYYELTYVPTSREYDGHFHKIQVRVDRPDVRVQARSGYFALPKTDSNTLNAFEVPLLAALNAKPIPRDFDYKAALLHFGPSGDRVTSVIAVELPLQNVGVSRDDEKKTYQAHFSCLALIKDATGHVVEKFSEDVPFGGPVDKLPAFQQWQYHLARRVALPPGRYTLETVVLDREAAKASAKRALFILAPPGPVSMSHIVVVRRLEALTDPDDPLRFQGKRIVPMLSPTIKAGDELQLYVSVHPKKEASEPAQLTLEFLQDGALVARGTPELPGADETGAIRYIASSPTAALKPGQYEVRVTARQGADAAQERTSLTIE